MVAGLLLAAGAGTRFGQPKALLPFAGKPLVQHGIETLRAGGCSPVHVVLGAVQAQLPDVVVVDNPDWSSGLASSLRAGLASLPEDARAVVVALVDQPLIGPAVVQRLIDAREAGAQIAIATYNGRRGNPVLLPRELWPDVAATAHGDVGARTYLQQHPEQVTAVECADIADPADIDTSADLTRLEVNWYQK